MIVLGLDTSNYTSSAALFDSETGRMKQQKMLLPVPAGARGLRQSDAVFHHTVQLPQVVEALMQGADKPDAVCASLSPLQKEGSYMPCFLVGAGAGRMIAETNGVPFYGSSHQQGHIAAAAFGAGQPELLQKRFLAFHVSGGTTQALLVSPNSDGLFQCEVAAESGDLKAGQAIDRVGVMLGLRFPCGPALDTLSLQCGKTFRPKISFQNGCPSLSGIENQCRAMHERGEPPEDTAKFCLDSIGAALEGMLRFLLDKHGSLPVLFAGGVMSNTLLRERFRTQYDALFAPPSFSADNAAGIAYIGYLKHLHTME